MVIYFLLKLVMKWQLEINENKRWRENSHERKKKVYEVKQTINKFYIDFFFSSNRQFYESSLKLAFHLKPVLSMNQRTNKWTSCLHDDHKWGKKKLSVRPEYNVSLLTFSLNHFSNSFSSSYSSFPSMYFFNLFSTSIILYLY